MSWPTLVRSWVKRNGRRPSRRPGGKPQFGVERLESRELVASVLYINQEFEKLLGRGLENLFQDRLLSAAEKRLISKRLAGGTSALGTDPAVVEVSALGTKPPSAVSQTNTADSSSGQTVTETGKTGLDFNLNVIPFDWGQEAAPPAAFDDPLAGNAAAPFDDPVKDVLAGNADLDPAKDDDAFAAGAGPELLDAWAGAPDYGQEEPGQPIDATTFDPGPVVAPAESQTSDQSWVDVAVTAQPSVSPDSFFADAAASFLDAGPLAAQAGPTAPSPTGRSPRLLWTPQQQAVWNRMRAENHPWWQAIQSKADATGTQAEAYGDIGQFATLAYQVTGDRAYAAKAWATIQPVISGDPYDPNYVREYFAEYALMYDWLQPALSASQRTEYINGLNHWCEWSLALNAGPNFGGFRLSDSDQTWGQYLGLALVDLATGPDNPRAGTWLQQVSSGWGDNVPVGGLDATASDWSTVRNVLRWRLENSAAGGVWYESSDYNLNTVRLVIMGVQAIETATGTNHFPEATPFFRQAALAMIYQVTSDLGQEYQWGDVEHPREFQTRLFDRMTTLCMLQGVLQNDPQVGPYLNQFVNDLVAKYGASGWASAEPWWRAFYFYNPYADIAAPSQQLPNGYYSPGAGLLYFHAGWGAADSFFGAQAARDVWEDHGVRYLSNFQLYRHGEWAVTNPLGYSGVANSGAAVNGMLIAGLSAMGEMRGAVAQEFGARGEFAYLAATTGGQYYQGGYYQPPATFLHEWTRSLFYLPSADGRSDTVVVFDRVWADDPRSLPGFDRYSPAEQQAILEAPALKQWVIHAPVAPTVTADGVTWQTAGGQTVQVTSLTPAGQSWQVYDESQLWAGTFDFHADEVAYQARLTPNTQQSWDTFLNVVQASDGDAGLRNTLVRSDGGEAQGALVQRAGQPDALVLFGAQQAGRVLSSGYTARWTGGSAGTTAYLTDLDPAKTWSVRIDGGAATTLAVSPQGIGQLTLNGAGSHVLELIAA